MFDIRNETRNILITQRVNFSGAFFSALKYSHCHPDELVTIYRVGNPVRLPIARFRGGEELTNEGNKRGIACCSACPRLTSVSGTGYSSGTGRRLNPARP